MSATDAGQREAVWARLLELETPRIESGRLLHGLGQVAFPLPWASMSSSIKWVESHLSGRGMARTRGCERALEVLRRCLFSSPLPSLVEGKHDCKLGAPAGPATLLCGVDPGEGFLRALPTMFASPEIELFSRVRAPKRKCLSLEPHILQNFMFIQEPLTGRC